jgi:hypothetical protein
VAATGSSIHAYQPTHVGVGAQRPTRRRRRGLLLQDYKLGVRMLVKYPGLTIAGGLALAIAIGIGAGWYDLMVTLLWPRIPLPDGDRLVIIETQDPLAYRPELRVTRDFLEWRRDVRSIDGLGAYRTDLRNLIVGHTPPVLIRTAALTATAFRTARVTPLMGHRGRCHAERVPLSGQLSRLDSTCSSARHTARSKATRSASSAG